MVTKVNKWNRVFDFTKKEDGDNYKLIDPSDFKIVHAREMLPDIVFEEYESKTLDEDYLFELPVEFGGTL